MAVHATHQLNNLLWHAARFGVQGERVARSHGLLAGDEGYADAELWFSFWQELMQLLPADFPLRAARATPEHSIHVLRFIAQTAPDFRTRLKAICLWWPLITTSFIWDSCETPLGVSLAPLGLPLHPGARYAYLHYTAAFVWWLPALPADERVIVDWSGAAPSEDPSLLPYAYQRAQVGMDALHFPNALLDAAQPGSNPGMHAYLMEQASEALDRLQGQWPVRVRLMALLQQLPPGQWTLDGVSDHLVLSRRSLQRWLEQEGVSFRGVLDELRASRARLLAPHLDDDALVVALGYAEPTSLQRAFRRWTGHSTGSYRAHIRALALR